MIFQGEKVAEVDVDFLFQPPLVKRRATWKLPAYKEPTFKEPADLTAVILSLLSSPDIASREAVVRTYDHEVKGNTVIKPLQGKWAGPNDAAVLKPLNDSWMGLVISCGMNPSYGKIDPYWMAASSLDEAIRNNTAVGGRRIALLDNFTWGNPEKPDRLGSLIKACEACYDVAKGFGTPFISGKDSLYNESPTGPVTPTLLITAVGIIPDVREAVSLDLKKPGNLLYLIGQTLPELGGSEYHKLRGYLGKTVPKVHVDSAKKRIDALIKAIDSGCVRACHDLSEGGLAVAVAEMALASDYGLDLWLKNVSKPRSMKRNDFILFSESNSRFLVEVPKNRKSEFEGVMQDNAFALAGHLKKEPSLSIHGLDDKRLANISLEELRKTWKGTLGGS
jgi:phosphoribosylformylglycinamidine synthase